MYLIIFISIAMSIFTMYATTKVQSKVEKNSLYSIVILFVLTAVGNYFNNVIFYYLFIISLLFIPLIINRVGVIEKKSKAIIMLLFFFLLMGYLSSFFNLPFKYFIFLFRYIFILVLFVIFLKSISTKKFFEKYTIFALAIYFLMEIYIKIINNWF